MPHRTNTSRFALLVAAIVVCGTIPLSAAPLYHVTIVEPTVTYFGQPVGQEINNAGQVISLELSGSGPTNTYLYSGGTRTLVGPASADTQGHAINSSGEIVGTTITQLQLPNAFSYSNGTFTDLATVLHGTSSNAFGINDAGQIVGNSTFTVGLQQTGLHAFLLSSGVVTDLTNATGGLLTNALAINSSGQIAGTNSAGHAALFSGGIVADLGTLPGETSSSAIGINDTGQVIAVGATSGSFGFLVGGGTQIDLDFRPKSINDSGQVVGRLANQVTSVLYRDGTTYNVMSILDSTGADLQAFLVNSINDNGWMTGWGLYDGAVHNLVLIPVPEPAGMTLAALGAGPLLALATRRRNSASRFQWLSAICSFQAAAETNPRKPLLGQCGWAGPIEQTRRSTSHTMKASHLTTLLIAVILCSWPITLSAAPLYHVNILASPTTFRSATYGHKINNAGQVIALYYNGSQTTTYLYAGGTVTQIGPANTFGNAINASGQIVGITEQGPQGPLNEDAFLYANGTFTDMAPVIHAGTSTANGINDAGQIVGNSYTPGQNVSVAHAFLYSGGTTTDLTTLTGGSFAAATAINSSGQIVGTNSAGHAALLSGGTVTDLGTLPGETTSTAIGINDSGQVLSVGATDLSFGFLSSAGSQTDLGFRPTGINNSGQIVGRLGPSPVLDSNGTIYNLMSLLDSTSGSVGFLAAYSINDNGWIAGFAATQTGLFDVVLVPVPEPAGVTLAALSAGALLALATRRRHA